MVLIKYLPSFAIILLLYWVGYYFGFFPDRLNSVIFSFELPSRAVWRPTWGDFIVLLGLFALYIEVYKSTQTSSVSIVNHTLSTVIFIVYLISWMVLPWSVGEKSNSTFLLLAVMSLIDVLAGFTITIAAARRDFG